MPRPNVPSVFKKRKNVCKSKIEGKVTVDLPESGDGRAESASARKLSGLNELYDEVDCTEKLGYELIDLNILYNILNVYVACKHCSQVGLQLKTQNRIGLATEIILYCDTCDYSVAFFTSKAVSNKHVDPDSEHGLNEKGVLFECNMRLAYGLRAVGKGSAAAQSLCGILNLPTPPSRFTKYNKIIAQATKDIAELSMRRAVEESVEANDGSRDLRVAFDGSWQKRGHTSLNGIVSTTSVYTGKILDIQVLTKHCRCKSKDNHDEMCTANYQGVSGGMEVAGAISIYQRSEEKYNVRYLEYLGDGDSKAFSKVNELKVYGNDIEIRKLECIGHIQKRMGTRLRRLKISLKGIKLADGKPLSGKNRLTDAIIDKIQNYYGLAIRRHSNNVENMKRAVWAMYFHMCSTDDEPQHGLCPPGEESWCKFRKAEAKGDHYHHNHSVPAAVMIAIKPVIRDLANTELLKKCTHGRTQNPNESVNSVVWSRLPKTVFVGLSAFMVGVYDAVGCFNEGNITRCRVLKQFGMSVGINTKKAMLQIDRERLRNAERNVSEYEKKARQSRRQAKKRLADSMEDPDNPEYGAGLF